MIRRYSAVSVAALAAVLLLAPGRWTRAQVSVKGIDLYRSRSLAVEQIQQKLGSALNAFLYNRGDGRKSTLKTAGRLKTQIERDIRKLGDFASVELHYAEYVTSAERAAYVTFDVVDAQDAKTRMPFRPAPARQEPDPDGLLAAWQEYAELGNSLLRQGLLPATGRSSCPSFFCLWASTTSALEALEKRFADGAAPNKDALLKVFRHEASAQKRVAAVYLLSYLKDAPELTGLLLEALQDPAPAVRGAALQVFSDIALYHKSIFVEINRIIPVLDYPTSSDRAKALALLVGLADNPTYRPYVLTRATPYLPRLLRLKQPSNHDLAFTLLATLSQESFDRRDYASWESWVAGVQRSTSPVTISEPAPAE